MKKKIILAMMVCVIFFVSLSTVTFYLRATNKVTTLPATNITATSATLNASVEPDGCGGTVEFTYVEAANSFVLIAYKKMLAETLKPYSTSKKTVTYNITGLVADTEYQYYAIGKTGCATDISTGSRVTFTTLKKTMMGSIIPMTFAPPSTTTPPSMPPTLLPMTPPPTLSPGFPGGTPPPAPGGTMAPPLPGGPFPPPVPGGTPGPSPPMPPPQCPGPQLPPQPGQPELPPPQPPSAGIQNMTLYLGMGVIGLLLIVLIILVVVMMNRGKRPPRIYTR